MLFKKDYHRAVTIVKDVQKVNKTAAIIVEQAFVDFFSQTDGKFDAEKFHEASKKDAKPSMKWTFKAGTRKVTVQASTLKEARELARESLDRRLEKAGQEPPVGWDLELVRDPRERPCPEGGVHDFTPDVEYDATGQTVNCSKCGEAKPC